MEVLGLRAELELQLLTYPIATATHVIRAAPATYPIACSNVRSLTY